MSQGAVPQEEHVPQLCNVLHIATAWTDVHYQGVLTGASWQCHNARLIIHLGVLTHLL